MTIRRRLAVTIVAIACTSVANTAPTTFEVQNIILDDGGVVTGTFSFDPDDTSFFEVDLATSYGSSLFSGTTHVSRISTVYTGIGSEAALTAIRVRDADGTFDLFLRFVSPLYSGNSQSDILIDPRHSFELAISEPTYLTRNVVAGQVAGISADVIVRNLRYALGPISGTFGDGQTLGGVSTFFTSEPITFGLGDILVLNVLFDKRLQVFDFGVEDQYFSFGLDCGLLCPGGGPFSGDWTSSIEALGGSGDIWADPITLSFVGGGGGFGWGGQGIQITDSQGGFTGIRWTTRLTAVREGDPLTLAAFTGVQMGTDGIIILEVSPDADGDGVLDDSDLCSGTAASAAVDVNGCSDAQVDGDGDGVCNVSAPSGGPSVCTGTDNCPIDVNPGQDDQDLDTIGDACDDDIDGDTFSNSDDNCPTIANSDQKDFDNDGFGDACDDDGDGDGVVNSLDACANTDIPESVPTKRLRRNRYALTGNRNNDSVLIFDSTNITRIDTSDTDGCSCEQIVDALGIGPNHLFYGCSKSAMKEWIQRP